MKIVMYLIALGVIVFYSFRFIQVMIRMKHTILLPTTSDEREVLRKYPQKSVARATYSEQKWGIVVYLFMLLFMYSIFFIGLFSDDFEVTFYLWFFLPLIHSHELFNVFAIVDDGIISGSRFIAWKNMKSFEFIRIDINHKFYGYSREVNDEYELRIKTKGFPISCIVTSSDMIDKLSKILNEHGVVRDDKSEKSQ